MSSGAAAARQRRKGQKKRKTSLKEVSEHPPPVSKLVLRGLDRSHATIEADDVRLVAIQRQAVTIELQSLLTSELQLADTRPFSIVHMNIHSPSQCFPVTFGKHHESTRLAQTLLQLKDVPLEEELKGIQMGFVAYALRWLQSFGVVDEAKIAMLESNVSSSSKELDRLALRFDLNRLLVTYFDRIHQSLIDCLVDAIPTMPTAVAVEIVEYVLPNRPVVTSPTVKLRRLLNMLVFPVWPILMQSQTTLHADCLDHYLLYRREAANALDVILKREHATASTAITYVRSRAVRRRQNKNTPPIATAVAPASDDNPTYQSGYSHMKYAFYDFKRVGRHAWQATVVGTEMLQDVEEKKKESVSTVVDAPRTIRLWQAELGRRPWILACYSPQLVLSFRAHWTTPMVPAIDYWHYICTNHVGMCNKNYNWNGADVTAVLNDGGGGGTQVFGPLGTAAADTE